MSLSGVCLEAACRRFRQYFRRFEWSLAAMCLRQSDETFGIRSEGDGPWHHPCCLTDLSAACCSSSWYFIALLTSSSAFFFHTCHGSLPTSGASRLPIPHTQSFCCISALSKLPWRSLTERCVFYTDVLFVYRISWLNLRTTLNNKCLHSEAAVCTLLDLCSFSSLCLN